MHILLEMLTYTVNETYTSKKLIKLAEKSRDFQVDPTFFNVRTYGIYNYNLNYSYFMITSVSFLL